MSDWPHTSFPHYKPVEKWLTVAGIDHLDVAGYQFARVRFRFDDERTRGGDALANTRNLPTTMRDYDPLAGKKAELAPAFLQFGGVALQMR